MVINNNYDNNNNNNKSDKQSTLHQNFLWIVHHHRVWLLLRYLQTDSLFHSQAHSSSPTIEREVSHQEYLFGMVTDRFFIPLFFFFYPSVFYSILFYLWFLIYVGLLWWWFSYDRRQLERVFYRPFDWKYMKFLYFEYFHFFFSIFAFN